MGDWKAFFPLNEKDILDIPVEKRLFVFWQSPQSATPPPGYISLCLETFTRFNPDISILFLNYDNIPLLVKKPVDLRYFSLLSFPMQSDILFIYFLYEYGGAFIDCDMIFTRKFNLFTKANPRTLYAFGESGKFAHLAFFLAHHQKNFILWHVLQMQLIKISLIESGVGKLNWDYVGNSIVNPLVEELSHSQNLNKISIISSSSMFPERLFENETSNLNAIEMYRKFYFSSGTEFRDVLEAAREGVIYLHNSWTPEKYKQMSANDFIKQDILLAKIFKQLLEIDSVDEGELIKIPIAKASTLIVDDTHKNIKTREESLRQEYENSTSWKLTKPLRTVSRAIKKIKRRLAPP